MEQIFQDALNYLVSIDPWELTGLIFGLLAVYLLIKENILTWPAGIIYCLVSFYIFWNAKLYQDFGLTAFFLVMNIYGWYEWANPKKTKKDSSELPITSLQPKTYLILTGIAVVYISVSGFFFSNYTDASLPYADATTTGLSLIAMWMTAKKKIENWILWFIVDVLATIIYFYKGIYFYSFLYLIYIVMAVSGYMNWKRIREKQVVAE